MPRVKLKKQNITPGLINSLNLGVAQSLGCSPYVAVSQKTITEKFSDGTGGYADIDELIARVKDLESSLKNTKLLLMEVSRKANQALKKSESADKLTTPRIIELTGDVMGLTQFDGSEDVEILTDVKPATLTQEGIVKLSDSLENNSTSEAATANSVNILYNMISDLDDKITSIPKPPKPANENSSFCLKWDEDQQKFIWVDIAKALGYGG